MASRVLMALGGGPIGGAEAFFVSLAAALKRSGLDVHAVLRNSPIHLADLAAAEIPCNTAPFGGPWDFFTTTQFVGLTRKLRPDVVLAFASGANARMPKGDY